MIEQLSPILESNNFIVLDSWQKIEQKSNFQSEAELENELISDLQQQGYEYLNYLTTHEALIENCRHQLETLNHIQFSDDEWQRFLTEFLDQPSENMIDKTRKLHENYICDFTFDDGHVENIYLLDKKNLLNNRLQVINQFEGSSRNRYDVTLLVNGLPLVQIELKKRGVAIREAFNQIHRYSKESFNKDNSLFQYLQLFVISNGTDTRYFANTTARDKNSFDFTMNWALKDNEPIRDLKDFTATFLSNRTLLNVLINYSIFNTENILMLMRPYQIAATERIIWKIQSSFNAKNWSKPESGGYIWHTTGSGKTLTSFKAAQLATELDFIDKVFFVVDRKDLDYQTMKEYQKFSPDSVNGSDSTEGLKRNIEKNDHKIIVTTIQKLNNFMTKSDQHDIYNKQVVFIFDECHRSQFGRAQSNLTKKFKKFYQFGFTGTPIFEENALTAATTQSVFGLQLHSYVITDAIRDQKVLKFLVDYNDVRPNFKKFETEIDESKLSSAEYREALLSDARIEEISHYIQENYRYKTHQKQFNAIFAVSSVKAAKLYYEKLTDLQKSAEKPLKIATIFSFAANEEQTAYGEISDETFEPQALDLTGKEFLEKAISDYNEMFQTNYSTESQAFQNYYKDLAKRVKSKEIDLLIVVGMFLTGFDAPTLNTLFVDKNLQYHGLIQAFSRTNRIYNSTKSFGNIVTFRDLETQTTDAIKLFGKSQTADVILERKFDDYFDGYENEKGYLEVVNELQEKFPDPTKIEKEADKKEFVQLFSQFLKLDNILQNYDEFTRKQLEESSDLMEIRQIQDYRSVYNDIKDWINNERENKNKAESKIDWDDVVFEVELLKSQEINLDYILDLIAEEVKKGTDKSEITEKIVRELRASYSERAKESLISDFIHQMDLSNLTDVQTQFYDFAKAEKEQEISDLISVENLKSDEAKRYIKDSIKRHYASSNGEALGEILPKMSPLNPNYLTKKQSVFEKISQLVEKFKGI